ncbi:Tetratricopeptide repeat protein [Bremerella volcania]|uniref:Tetratricopeptide repeat protein n=1 Tax=Bremerella volcania TaxID=2527984 RepID=A0A518C6I2_9BACT|nr:tetratricopeptide repeat protein [Bremerella volcania]QDU74835.1 Tetratricopeptide repeat protein [Bremerella volcania]
MSDGGSFSVSEDADYEVSPALRTQLQRLFDHATQMMSKPKYDYDYAHSLLGDCCKKDPANLVYVEKMLENLDLKFKGKKKGSLFSGFGGKGGLKKALSAKKWQDVIKEGIDLLKSNPYDSVTLRAMVDACEAMRYNEVGLRYMKNAMDGSPGDMEVMRHCARYLGRVGQFDQAISLWHFIEEKNRGDKEANQMISQLTIDRERRAKGLATVTNRIDPADAAKVRRRQAGQAGERKSEVQERPATKIELNAKQKLKAKIEADPDQLENYLKLMDLWVDEGKFFEAEAVWKEAQAHFGDSIELTEKQEDLLILKARHRYKMAENQASAQSSPQLLDLVETAKTDLNRLELEIYTKRNERHPDDLLIKYELGLRLKRMGNYEQAEELFDEISLADEKLLAICYLGKGECLQARKKFVTAMETYEEALNYADTLSSERLKLLLYRAGVLAQGLKEWTSATSYLKRLEKMDPSYKDVKRRLDKLK